MLPEIDIPTIAATVWPWRTPSQSASNPDLYGARNSSSAAANSIFDFVPASSWPDRLSRMVAIAVGGERATGSPWRPDRAAKYLRVRQDIFEIDLDTVVRRTHELSNKEPAAAKGELAKEYSAP